MENKDLNRLKVVLAEKKRTNKWLAEQLGKALTISGQIPLENYAQLFASFVQTLKNNNLKIEIKFTANTTGANPLSENSATVKSVKASASQLGLTFEAKE